MSSKAWKVGNNIDTDLIIAARYLNDASDENMRAHCMEDVIPDYANTIAPGDVLVAGSNFGCGSSREHAPIAIKVAGTKCVIAESFARIFYRNAINIACRSSNRRKLFVPSIRATSWRSISKTASSPTLQKMKPTILRNSRNSSSTLLKPAISSTM